MRLLVSLTLIASTAVIAPGCQNETPSVGRTRTGVHAPSGGGLGISPGSPGQRLREWVVENYKSEWWYSRISEMGWSEGLGVAYVHLDGSRAQDLRAAADLCRAMMASGEITTGQVERTPGNVLAYCP
jgi:hypothetical protein